MNATVESIAGKTTQQELVEGYRNLERLMNSTHPEYAVGAALHIAKIDMANLWKFLKSYASTDIEYTDTRFLTAVDALYNSWVQEPSNEYFLSHAVALLASATKNRNNSVLKLMPNKYPTQR